MSDWYYADADRQRHGPLTAAELQERFHHGQLTPDTLIWREGLPEWRPLRDLAGELGLDPAATAPATAQVSAAAPLDGSASPYAPPAAQTPASAAVVRGGDVVLAGFWKRAAALTIDSVVMTLVLLIALMAIMLLAGGASAFNPDAFASDLAQGTLGFAFLFGVYVVPLVLQALYFSWMHASGAQATLGKMAVGIKVARSNGETLGLGRSFGRWCAYFFINLVSCGLGTFVSAFTTGLSLRKQALHDMLADTLVVDKWAYTAHPERQRRELGTVTWVVIVLGALLVVAYFGFLILAIGMAAAAGH